MSMKRHAGRLLSSSPSLQRVNSGECLNLNDDVDNDVGTLSRQWSTRSGKCRNMLWLILNYLLGVSYACSFVRNPVKFIVLSNI